MVVKLQRDPDHVIALIGQHGCDNRTVYAARHGSDNAGFGRGFGEAKRIKLARRGGFQVSHIILQRVQGPKQTLIQARYIRQLIDFVRWRLSARELKGAQSEQGDRKGVFRLMETIDTFFATEIGTIQLFWRIGAACLFGAMLGLEREIRDRPAGLRTFMLVSLASCLFTLVALEISFLLDQPGDRSSIRPDPLRVVEAVTAGVAFIAAGAIIRNSGHLKGLTTGAGLWLAGAIGLACGAGFMAIAALVTVLALIIMAAFKALEKIIPEKDVADD
jgi:putative Mg2+ transporter-C (MgtC) family protein